MANRASKRNVRQFKAGHDTAQHQAAAAHVAPPDEVHWEHQPVAKNREQQVDILARCDAAEEDHFAVRTDGFPQRPGGLFERSSIGLVPEIDVAQRECTERFDGYRRVDLPQSCVRRDDENTSRDHRIGWIRRTCESTCVCELPAKVEAADKAEDFAERCAGRTLQLPRKVETCVRRQHHLRADTAAIGGREEEHARRR